MKVFTPSRPRRTGLAVFIAWSAVALLATPAAETAHEAKGKPRWVVFPRAKVEEGRPLLGLAWASNRVWVIGPHGAAATVASARVSGRTLGSFAATPLPGGGEQYVPIVDGKLVLQTRDRVVTTPLLADGRLGPQTPVADDLLARGREVLPKLESVAIQNGARVGNRTVWALEGFPECHSIGGCPSFFLACCSESGGAADLTRLIDRKVGATFPEMGLDGRGRLWLAWLDRRNYSRALRGVPRIVELDPSTLAPRSDALAAPRIVADKVVLACAALCRIVAQTAGGDIVSWAPGERSTTRVVRHWERGKWGDGPAWLFAASYRSGHLVVGFHGSFGKTIYADPSVRDEVRVARGDARGARARLVGKVATTFGWPLRRRVPPYLDPVVYGTFVQSGLVALEHFRQGNASSPVIYAFLPLGA